MCPPQHGGLLRPGHLCRSVCTCMRKYACDVCSRSNCPCFLFPGPDTKLMQNSGRTKFKRTSIDRLMNTLVLWVGHPKPLTFMLHAVTISGRDLSGLNLVSYISSNYIFYPNLGSTDHRSLWICGQLSYRHSYRYLIIHLDTCLSCFSICVFLSDLWLPGVYGCDPGCG